MKKVIVLKIDTNYERDSINTGIVLKPTDEAIKKHLESLGNTSVLSDVDGPFNCVMFTTKDDGTGHASYEFATQPDV